MDAFGLNQHGVGGKLAEADEGDDQTTRDPG
jgi:hypothetical protein